jgi:hypothetical protein
LNYYRMAAPPDKVYGGNIGSSYQQQGLALSKQFKRTRHPSLAAAPEVEGRALEMQSS